MNYWLQWKFSFLNNIQIEIKKMNENRLTYDKINSISRIKMMLLKNVISKKYKAI